MTRRNRMKMLLGGFAIAALAFAVTACGSSGSGSSSGGGEPSTSGSDSSSLAKAKEVVAPYIGQPSPFPVTEKLKEDPKGATIAFMDPGDPYSALLFELMQSAAEKLGVKLERIKAGSAANTVNTAFDTVVSNQPDAVIVSGIDIDLWKKQLVELQEDGIPVVTQGVAESEKDGIVAPQGGTPLNRISSVLLANYVPAEMNPEANVVIYDVPERTYSVEVAEKMTTELEKVCSGCTVRTTQIPAATLGTTAPNLVVSDLQANSETNVVILTNPETGLGLPAAMETAGIEVETLNYGPIPANLEQIKEGKETAGLGVDVGILAWGDVDLAVRQIVGQKPTGLQAEGIGVLQFLRQKDITFNPALGWNGYPEFEERFEKLWGVK